MEPAGLFVGLIPDGGRRAVDHDVDRYPESYERGAEVVGDVLKAVIQDDRVRIFTAWGLSDENAQKRPQAEIEILNQIFITFIDRLRRDVESLYCNVKVVHMGNENFLDATVQERVRDVVAYTADRKEKIFGMCLGYGAHEEMDRAVGLHCAHGATGDWRRFLDLPFRGEISYQPVDLIMRTGTDPGKPYTSGYLLPYQNSGTQEKYFLEPLPHMEVTRFIQAIDECWASISSKRKGA